MNTIQFIPNLSSINIQFIPSFFLDTYEVHGLQANVHSTFRLLTFILGRMSCLRAVVI